MNPGIRHSPMVMANFKCFSALIRFHMQRKGEYDFYITDVDHCPKPYRLLDTDLSAATLDLAKVSMPVKTPIFKVQAKSF